MTQVFLKILNMSITASWIILAVVLLRFLLKKTPKWVLFLLWGIVALRLVVPFSLESSFSLVPSGEVFPQDIASSQAPAIHSGFSAINSSVNPLITEHAMHSSVSVADILSVVSVVWLSGTGLMLLYGIFSYLLLRRRVRISIPYRDNVYLCDNIPSPFILNAFFPKIYIPSGIDQEQLQHVLAHEYAHIKRKDPLWKPFGFLLLSIYWFNPLLWIAYVLLCRDIELACDEKVISKLDAAGIKSYSQTLVACSVHRKNVMACPVAFGELSVKERIKNVLSYKKPAFWVVLASLVVCTALAACFLTNPVSCDHSYTSTVSTQPTCTQQGVESYTCQLCHYSYCAPTDVIAHSYSDPVVLQPATCTQPGVQESACSCGAKHTQSIPLTDHIDGELFVTKAPNCSEQGVESTKCTHCQAEYAVNILPTNQEHDLVETVLQAATCTASGEGIHRCTRCDYTESCVYEQLDHHYELYAAYPPTCQGQELYYRCTDCGFTRIEIGPEKGSHVWQVGSSFLPYKHCSLCGTSEPNENYSGYFGRSSLFDGLTGDKPSMPKIPGFSIEDPYL